MRKRSAFKDSKQEPEKAARWHAWFLERLLFRCQADVGVVLEHPSRKVSYDGFHHMVRLPGREQPGDDRAAQIVEPQAG
jgi:hypothetical protein